MCRRIETPEFHLVNCIRGDLRIIEALNLLALAPRAVRISTHAVSMSALDRESFERDVRAYAEAHGLWCHRHGDPFVMVNVPYSQGHDPWRVSWAVGREA